MSEGTGRTERSNRSRKAPNGAAPPSTAQVVVEGVEAAERVTGADGSAPVGEPLAPTPSGTIDVGVSDPSAGSDAEPPAAGVGKARPENPVLPSVAVAAAISSNGAAAVAVAGARDPDVGASRRVELTTLLREKGAAAGLSRRGSKLVAELVAILSDLEKNRASDAMYDQAALAASYAGNDKARNRAAQMILNHLRYSVSPGGQISVVLQGLALSLGAILVFGAAYYIIYSGFQMVMYPAQQVTVVHALHNSSFRFFNNPFIICVISGLLGASVSVLLRVSNYERSQRSRQFLIMAGAVLPIVGALFAGVAYGLFSSGIVEFPFLDLGSEGDPAIPNTASNLAFFVVIGFISGFSERFVRGLLGRIEGQVAEKNSVSVKETKSVEVETKGGKS